MNKQVGAKDSLPRSGYTIIQTNQIRIYCRVFENIYQLRPKVITIISNDTNFKLQLINTSANEFLNAVLMKMSTISTVTFVYTLWQL